MTTYKFRAETLIDIELFKIQAGGHISNLKAIPNDPETSTFPDITITFDSEMPIENLIYIMRKVEDGHVMFQTLKPIEEYTGERDYSI
tara:strand:- start:177 stop:440 length:264 start_codon:yes stop_codon:yes gene_type:complete